MEWIFWNLGNMDNSVFEFYEDYPKHGSTFDRTSLKLDEIWAKPFAPKRTHIIAMNSVLS